jgi:hypothetical protein
MAFDRHEIGAEAPVFVQNQLLESELVNDLNLKIERINRDDRGRTEVVKWLMSYLENRISHTGGGPIRKRIIINLLRDYYRNPEQLGDLIDFLHGEGLIKRKNMLVRLCCICGAYLRYKLL